MKFTFGKYKNKDVHETIDLDPNYCLWLYRSDLTKERNRTLFEILEKRFKDDDNFYMPWGKYRNLSLRQIAQLDERYINWLLNNDVVQNKHP